MAINVTVDLAFMLAFLVEIEEDATGLDFHEWFGLGLALFVLVHLLLHWRWAVAVTKRFFEQVKGKARIQYIVAMAMYVGFVSMILSGIVISRVVLQKLNIPPLYQPFWKNLHGQATNFTLVAAAVHLGIHWRWIGDQTQLRLISPLARVLRLQPRRPAQKPAHVRARRTEVS